MNYGLIEENHLKDFSRSVCDCLGYGENGMASMLLVETARAETGAGKVKDTTVGAGMGITQIDKIPFYDILERVRDRDKEKVFNFFGIDLDLIEWEHLRYNPLLCLIFTRLKYKLIPEIIPTLRTKRADYWKKYYNTKAGKGTVAHYISANT